MPKGTNHGHVRISFDVAPDISHFCIEVGSPYLTYSRRHAADSVLLLSSCLPLDDVVESCKGTLDVDH